MKKQKNPQIYITVPGFSLLLILFLALTAGCDKSSTSNIDTIENPENIETIRLGIHYEYPFGGMATRSEWMPKGEADWRRDIAKIKETGLNSIRIRIGMDSDLDEVATLLDIIHEQGLTVIFGFATFYVNDDFVESHPDSKVVGGDGSVLPVDKNDLRWQRACIDYPVYRQLRNKIIENCVSRFQNHPAVIVWDVHNEPAVNGHNACFCTNTLAKYRALLKEEYSSIQLFNQAFGENFRDFNSVRPPAERTEENEEFYIHWREFMASDLNNFLLEGREIIKKYIPDAIITHNVTEFESLGWNGQDWWLLTDYNLLTMSRYLGVTESAVGRTMGYEVLKAMNPGRPAWVTEFQGGPFPSPGPGILFSGKEAEIGLNSVLSHGLKGLYFYRWDPLLNGAEPMVNGMIEPDGYDTDRRLGLKQAISDLEPHLPFIARARSFEPSVGIYFSRDQVMRSRNGELGSSTRRAYTLLSDIGYEAACIVLGTKELDRYKTVVFPYVSDLSNQEIDDIETYILNGGTAIIDLPAQDPETARRFADKFGIKTGPSEKLQYWLHTGWSVRGTGEGLNLSDNAFGGYCFNGRLLLEGNGAVLKYDDNGAPAALRPEKYEGRLLITGCRLFYSYGVSMHKRTRQVVQSFIGDYVEPDFVLEGADEEFRPYLEARVLEDKNSGKAMLFLINRSPHKSYSLKVNVKGYKPVKVEAPSYDVVRVMLTT